jgi:hypothetical protein
VAYVNLADAHLKLGDEAKAADDYRQDLKLWPDSPRVDAIRELPSKSKN